MVAKIFALIFLLSSTQALAAKGAVIALEAPYFEKEDTNSRIVQYVRKGQVIFVHDKHVVFSEEDSSEFYQVVDKSGQTAFVPKKYVKLFFKDRREYAQEVSPFEHDPTDYRLKEPLPPKYPQLTDERYRGIASFALGPSPKTNYPYTQTISNENFSPRRGLQIAYMKNAQYDTINRFYFGADFHFWQYEADFNFTDGTTAREENGQYSLGPIASYDAFRNDDFRLVFIGGFNFNYNRAIITVKNGEEEEERTFTAYTITPQVGSQLQWTKILPSVDLVLGANMQFNLPYLQNPSSGPILTGLWNEEADRVSYPLGGVFTVFLGIQNIY